ncbi:hypothetical protein ACLK19_11375 [Escherichia coli]
MNSFRRQSAGRLPALSREVNGFAVAYLDSAASAQKPSQVIDAEAEFIVMATRRRIAVFSTLSAQADRENGERAQAGHRC